MRSEGPGWVCVYRGWGGVKNIFFRNIQMLLVQFLLTNYLKSSHKALTYLSKKESKGIFCSQRL